MKTLFALLMTALMILPVVAKDATKGLRPGSQVGFCAYPSPTVARTATPGFARATVAESESNDTIGTANAIALPLGSGAAADTEVTGSLTNGDDDYFEFTVNKGDFIGAVVLGAGAPDSILDLRSGSDTILISNDDHGGQADFFGASSPFPGGSNNLDSVVTWVAPAAGTYYLTVRGFGGTSTGSYTLQIFRRLGGLSSQIETDHQIVFIDFDGATGFNAAALFGGGGSNVTLSPLASFLAGWGLTGADESAVIDAIMAGIEENFDDLRLASLNGNYPVDNIAGHFDIEFRNSRDDADTFGDSNVSRVIVGGTIAEIGFSTIGIASAIDPGNYGLEDTAVVLLDLLSGSSPDPNSINSIPLDAGSTIIDAIGVVTGAIVVHEIGHYLGNWHTDNNNGTRSVMDQGGNIPINIAGVGVNGIFGDGDDEDVDFSTDDYANEGIDTGSGRESTAFRSAFGLPVGLTLVPVELLDFLID